MIGNLQSQNVKHKHQDSAVAIEVVSATGASPSADSSGKRIARAVMVQTAGTLSIKVPHQSGPVTVAFPAGIASILIEQIKSGGTAQGVTLLY